MPSSERTVVIIQRVLPHYRVAFFSLLSHSLRNQGVRLRVLYGQELPGSVPQSVHPNEEWAEYIPNHYWSVCGVELVWQSCLWRIGASDLVIVEQANRLLVNYILILMRSLGNIRLAYWGHGRNLQSINRSNVRERIKQALLLPVDWWFTYTQLSTEIVRASGYPVERITVVENTINTDDFEQAIASVTGQQLDLIRDVLGPDSGPVALYCGGMYPDKQLPFLLKAALALHKKISNFRLILIGSGPDQNIVEHAAAEYSWIHYVGALYGLERAAYFLASDVMLMPGPAGLAIVDSFVARVPMITRDIPTHGPEIAYLEHDVNGVITSSSLDDFVAQIFDVLTHPDRLAALRDGCSNSRARYTINSMVDNFSAGIISCLEG